MPLTRLPTTCHYRLLSIGLTFVTAITLSSCAQPIAAGSADGGGYPPPESQSTSATDTAANLDDALAATIRGLDPGVVQKATMGIMADENLAQLRVTVAVPSDEDGDALIPEWEAALLAGAAADRLTARGTTINRAVGAYEYIAVTPDGKTVDQQGAAIPPNLAGSHFPAAGLSDQKILDKVQSAVDNQGWTLVSSRVLHPLDPAVALTVRMPTEEKDYSEQFRLLSNAIRTLDYAYSPDPDQCAMAGDAIEVQNFTGERVLVSTQSCRAQAGSVWSLPDGPIDVPHSGPPPAEGQ